MKAVKVERYAVDVGTRKRFLDVHYHANGTRIHHLRRPCPKAIHATQYDRGRALTWQGDSDACWVINARDESEKARERVPSKRNKQESKEKSKREDWQEWHQRFENGDFNLVATIGGALS